VAHGDEIQLLADGPLIRPKAVEPLGIYHGSTCWGLWVHGRPSRNHERRKKLRAGGNEQLPHLVISPIHPDSWPIAFHLEIMLRHTPTALPDVLEIIARNNVDLHFTEFCDSGYQSSQLTAIGEVEDLKHWHTNETLANWYSQAKDEEFDQKLTELGGLPRAWTEHGFKGIGWGHDSRREPKWEMSEQEHMARVWLCKAIGRRALGHVTWLWIALRHEEYLRYRAQDGHNRKSGDVDPDGDYFFPSRVIQLGRTPFFLRLSDPSLYDLHPDGNGQTEEKRDRAYDAAYNFYLETECSPITEHSKEAFVARNKKLGARLAELHAWVCSTPNLQPEVRAADQTAGGSRPLTIEAMLASKRTSKQWGVDLLSRIFESHWRKPVACRTMFPLMHARIFAIDRPPIEFSYDAQKGQLRAKNPGALHDALEEFWYRTEQARMKSSRRPSPKHPAYVAPKIAEAYIDERDRFIRLNFLDRRISDERLIEAVVGFTARRKTLDGKFDVNLSARGLMYAVSRAATANGLTIVRMTNRIERRHPSPRSALTVPWDAHGSDFDPTFESGAVKIVAKLPDGVSNRSTALRTIAKSLKSAWRTEKAELKAKGVVVKLFPSVYPHRFDRLFLSTVNKHERYGELLRIVTHVAKQFGFELVHVRQNIEAVTAAVKARLESCQACLQIATLRDDDRQAYDRLGPAFQPAFVWLHEEYAVAKTLQMPVIRMIDSLMPEAFRRQFKSVNLEVPPVEFAMNQSTATIQESVVQAIGQLREALSQNPRRVDFGRSRFWKL